MFRTEVNVPSSNKKISLKQDILCLGSCFAELIGQRLLHNKFSLLVNPYGVIYNPCSLVKLLEYSLLGTVPAPNTYIRNEGIYFNYEMHSSFSHLHLPALQQNVAQAITDTAKYLEKVKWIIFTLGTSYIYRRQDTLQDVANCHKMPDHLFQKRLLSVTQIVESFQRFIQLLDKKELNIVLTVSPVRHLKTGLIENSLSKATLRLAAEQLSKNHEQVTYFPSYEIMMDDLRDYRFYEKDLIHPNEVAQDYIWQRFSDTFFDTQALEFIKDWSKILQALKHKPFHPNSENHQIFLRKTLSLLNSLKDQIDVTQEME